MQQNFQPILAIRFIKRSRLALAQLRDDKGGKSWQHRVSGLQFRFVGWLRSTNGPIGFDARIEVVEVGNS
jgi:hypothetical protein